MAGGGQGPVSGRRRAGAHLNSGLLVRVQAAAAVSGPRQPGVTVGSIHREHVPRL